ncbi:MAG: bifunctional glutamate N-acetyltransferase/amino-acid acetyltransferase ArgJ [Planctomycetota bacterium]
MSKPTGSITRPKGFRAAGGVCGVKASGKPDLALIVADGPCSAAGVFTRNKVLGAPVMVGKRHVRNGQARAIVCNSGNSNVATGRQGLDDAVAMCRATAEAVGCAPGEVLPASTGIIGRVLPIEKITAGIASLAPKLKAGPTPDTAAARAILTTDLVTKSSVRRLRSGVTIGGIAKGSGMIAPSMATMLGFITTDAEVPPPVLRQALREATDASFNRISVDTDTSTSDTVYVLASGQAARSAIKQPSGSRYTAFVAALTEVCGELAEAIVRDGEGMTKLFRVEVSGAKSMKDADRVGRAIAESPLVKTAIHGADPNWGRIAMAAGKSGAALKPESMTIAINGESVYAHGVPVAMSAALEKRLSASMRKTGRDVQLSVDLGLGHASCTWLGCDLTREYITINADYTT